MRKYSMNEVRAGIDDLNALVGLVGRGQKVAILHAVVYQPGWAADDAVSAYAADVLMRFPV